MVSQLKKVGHLWPRGQPERKMAQFTPLSPTFFYQMVTRIRENNNCWCIFMTCPRGGAVSHAAAAPSGLAESFHPSYPECKVRHRNLSSLKLVSSLWRRQGAPLPPELLQPQTLASFSSFSSFFSFCSSAAWKHWPSPCSAETRRSFSPDWSKDTRREWASWQRRSCTQR